MFFQIRTAIIGSAFQLKTAKSFLSYDFSPLLQATNAIRSYLMIDELKLQHKVFFDRS